MISRDVRASDRLMIDAECDCFEAEWKAGCPGRIEDHLSGWVDDAACRQLLLRELVLIDLEYRWRSFSSRKLGRSCPDASAPSNSPREPQLVPERPLLEDYFLQFPELGYLGKSGIEMIVSEYRMRQRMGDRPDVAAYEARFPHHAAALEITLRHIAVELTPTVVQIFRGHHLFFETELDTPLEIGRQKRGEPGPYSRVPGHDVDRVIITPLTDNTVSRSHLHLDVVGKNRLNVTNRSTKSGVVMNATKRMPPGSRRRVERPVFFQLGGKVIRLIEA